MVSCSIPASRGYLLVGVQQPDIIQSSALMRSDLCFFATRAPPFGNKHIFLLDLIGLFWKEQSGFERKAWNWDLPNKSQKQPHFGLRLMCFQKVMPQ